MFLPNLISPTFLPPAQIDRVETPKRQPPTHNTGRDPGDHRSKEEIISGPLFKNLTSSDLDTLPVLTGERLESFYVQIGGDYNDPNLTDAQQADLAANAERVLEEIDRQGGFSSVANNKHIENPMIVDYKIGPPRPYTEGDKVNRFSLFGYSTLLDSELNRMDSTSPPVTQSVTTPPTRPTPDERRPLGDKRTALEISSSNSLMFDLLGSHNFSRNPAAREEYLNDLANIVGNFRSTNPNIAERADAMFRLTRVIEFINHSAPDFETTKIHLKEFSKKGYPVLEQYKK